MIEALSRLVSGLPMWVESMRRGEFFTSGKGRLKEGDEIQIINNGWVAFKSWGFLLVVGHDLQHQNWKRRCSRTIEKKRTTW